MANNVVGHGEIGGWLNWEKLISGSNVLILPHHNITTFNLIRIHYSLIIYIFIICVSF
jgi:hypothetical protein